MANKKRWVEKSLGDGINQFTLSAWKHFPDLINNELLEYTGYIYRGQGKENWDLEPSLDRLIKKLGKTDDVNFHQDLMLEFQRSTRGRLEQDRNSMEPNDWWALGQHHGLTTPLLDWTLSPYIAAFFAFLEDTTDEEYVVV